ncbi:MAG TPA: hypothetical protein VFA50_19810 [Stellaceae bacterium]|nr:hypothetical protein [Stellaceae bacterium]
MAIAPLLLTGSDRADASLISPKKISLTVGLAIFCAEKRPPNELTAA